MKKHLFPIVVAVLLCLSAGIFCGSFAFAESQAERSLESIADNPQDTLFKNYLYSEKTVRAVCEKFGLDFHTVTVEEVFSDRERLDYTSAAALKLEHGDSPLFTPSDHNSEFYTDTLEMYLNEVYAFDGGRQIIEEACEDYQVSKENGKISSFTISQLMEIERRAYETSPHPH